MKLSKNKISRIRDCFSGLGPLTKKLPVHLDFYSCPHWRNGVMSPNILLTKNITELDFQNLERFFKKYPAQGKHESMRPRLCLFKNRYYNLKSIEVRAKENGWLKLDSKETINIWESATPVQIPKGYHFKVARYFDKAIHKDFIKMMTENFGTNKVFLRDLARMHKTIDEKLLTVVIYNSKKRPVAAGLVVTANRASFLYCGSVAKRYRQKGLWKLLVAARQAASNTGPGHIWVTNTFNPNIMFKGTSSMEVVRYYRPE